MSSKKNTPSAKKSVKKFATKKNYASKLVGDSLEKIIQSKLKVKMQNTKTITKWMAKMKLSILKKVSQASKVAFNPQGTSTTHYRSEIVFLKEKIAQQTVAIKDAATKALMNSKLSEIPQPDNNDAIAAGRFDSQTDRIKEQFGEVATKLSKVLTDMNGYVENLNTSLAATEFTFKQINQQMISNMSNKTRSHTKSKQITGASSSSGSGQKAPVEILFQHLEKI